MEEMAYLSTLPDYIWASIGALGCLTGSEYKTEALCAAHVSIAFMRFRLLRSARELPWSLAQGNILENLEALSRGDAPAEPIAGKACELLKRLGYTLANRKWLQQAILLLLEIRWDVVVAEQQHASGTLIARFHTHIEQLALMTRALVHTLRRLLPAPSDDEKKEERLRKSWSGSTGSFLLAARGGICTFGRRSW